ncbi:hypothetical protein PVAP13_3KG261697 [Panicum virgatum]|uniref:Uncharacterized protein n=1 Tax=Panicum virgatum TaxID=38727 RepID=A0A8T0V6L2_PANVG|nr:hypothetical protein PVAP13_3KG261697 [Panicum virgatum]
MRQGGAPPPLPRKRTPPTLLLADRSGATATEPATAASGWSEAAAMELAAAARVDAAERSQAAATEPVATTGRRDRGGARPPCRGDAVGAEQLGRRRGSTGPRRSRPPCRGDAAGAEQLGRRRGSMRPRGGAMP